MVAPVPFCLDLPAGLCVGVPLPPPGTPWPEQALTALHPEERAHAGTLTARRQRTWVGGRLALRQALTQLGREAPPLGSTARGAPQLPAGLRGSVSHKDTLAVALLSLEGPGAVGVDVELVTPGTLGIAKMVLTEAEVAELHARPAAEQRPELLVRFSAKEALYKALDPFVQRYVGFQEVAVRPLDDGTLTVRWHLREGTDAFAARAWWLRRGDVLLTAARVWPC